MNNIKAIKEYILESNLLSDKEQKKVSEYMLENNKNFLDSILDLNFFDIETINKIIAIILGTKFINLNQTKIDFNCAFKIPYLLAEEYNLFCFNQNKDILKVAFCNILDIKILEDIFPKKQEVEFFYATKEQIIEKNRQYKRIIEEDVIFKTKNQ